MTFGIGIRVQPPPAQLGRELAMAGFYDQRLSYGDPSITQYLYLYAMSYKQSYQKKQNGFDMALI